jgi:hypothetical protein
MQDLTEEEKVGGDPQDGPYKSISCFVLSFVLEFELRAYTLSHSTSPFT